MQSHPPGVSAIVPAYNEAARIGPVLATLSAYQNFSEVIVVDDGSTDGTRDVVARYPRVRCISYRENQGKGYALQQGIVAAREDIFFFCDADIRGLTPAIITATIAPVRRGEVAMFIAMCDRPLYRFTPFVFDFVLHLSGERCIHRALWERVPPEYKQKFKIETALNFYAARGGGGFRYRRFAGLTQVAKERKYGLLEGSLARLKMTADVLAAQWQLRYKSESAL